MGLIRRTFGFIAIVVLLVVDVDEAFALMHAGEARRAVLDLEAA